MFTRTYAYDFAIPSEHLKYRLVGNHVRVYNLDFEVREEDRNLSIKPIAEEEGKAPALSVVSLELQEQGNATRLVITSSMRTIAAGSDIVLMTFCILLLAASFVLLYTGADPVVWVTTSTVSLLSFVTLLIRLQLSYFGYIRSIRTFIKRTADQITTDVRHQLFKHKRK